MASRKRPRLSSRRSTDHPHLFDELPDDLLVSILCKLASAASCPSGFFNILLTCKRFNRLGMHPLVLSKAGRKVFSIKAKRWSESAHRFLKHCINAGNVEASYILGMIQFYSLQNRKSGVSLIAKAAIKCHAPALYSLAIIQFHGSGGSKDNRDLRAGVALCARAASLGHLDALREVGHCLQDGYGVPQNVCEGRRLLVQANARELAHSLAQAWQQPPRHVYSCLLSDFGCSVPARKAHPANEFLKEWFESGGPGDQLRMCSHSGCGRPETRVHEFRRCSVCGTASYCSRACQALDWRVRHKTGCVAGELWPGENGGGLVEVEQGVNVVVAG